MVDTSLYPPSYQQKLLTLLSEEYDLDDQTNGVLIHSDNFQALNLLQARYREQVKCIYIDPPYNTNASEILYKNGYKHSSWLSLLGSRLQLSYLLQSFDGIISVAIDDYEFSRLIELLNNIYGDYNQLGLVAVRINPKGRMTRRKFSLVHEYAIFYGKSENSFIKKLPENPEDKTHNYIKDDDGSWYLPINLRKQGVDSEAVRSDGTTQERYYPIYFCPETKKVSVSEILPVEIYPIDGSGQKRIWRRDKSVIEEMFNKGDLWVNKTPNGLQVYFKFRGGLDGKLMQSLWTDSKYSASDYGTKILDQTLGQREQFSYPKSPYTVIDSIRAMSADQSALILDYFAGSGTTAHAVINLNREDGGKRKYILVEQGEYFDTVLKPRIQKVIYSENWKNGKPVENASGSLNGVSQIVKVLKLESYEDTLNNLQLKAQSDLFKMLPEAVQEDYLLRYLLDTESKGSLLNSDDFQHPFDYRLNIATDSAGAYQSTVIDLPETFNYLLGIRVQQITDEREKRGYLTIEGLLPNDARCLIVWRDCEKMGYAEVAQFFDKHNINPNSNQYDVIYLNGDHDMANQWQNEDGSESRLALRAIEPEFLNRMFMEKGE